MIHELPLDRRTLHGHFSRELEPVLAVDAGSNEISVLSIGKDSLTLVDKVNSGGVRPISLTVHENFLYVLNEGGTPNITGFTVSDTGELTPLPGSTRPLTAGSAADPAEVSFNPDGSLLVVASGGKVWQGSRECEVFAEGLVARGVPAAQVLQECESLTTRGNARGVAELLRDKAPRRVGVVTCDWHMPRALQLFRRVGFDPIAVPATSPLESMMSTGPSSTGAVLTPSPSRASTLPPTRHLRSPVRAAASRAEDG